MKGIFTFIFSLILFNLANAYKTDTIVAVIDKNVITSTEVKKVSKNSDDVKKVINLLINQKILELEAKKLNIEPSKELIDLELVNLSRINKIPINVLIKSNNINEIIENIRQLLQVKILKDQIIEDASVIITEDEISNALAKNPKPSIINEIFVNQFNLKSIFVEESQSFLSEEALEQYVKNLSAMFANEGLSFLEVKNDLSKKSQVEYLTDWINERKIYPELFKELNSLEINTITSPIKTTNGWTFFQPVKKRSVDVTIENIKKSLYSKKFQDTIDKWIQDKSKNYFIKVFNEKI